MCIQCSECRNCQAHRSPNWNCCTEFASLPSLNFIALNYTDRVQALLLLVFAIVFQVLCRQSQLLHLWVKAWPHYTDLSNLVRYQDLGTPLIIQQISIFDKQKPFGIYIYNTYKNLLPSLAPLRYFLNQINYFLISKFILIKNELKIHLVLATFLFTPKSFTNSFIFSGGTKLLN